MNETAHEATGAHGGAEHHPGIGTLLWPVLNFVLFVVLLVRFLGGPIREFFRERTERLRQALEAGARARREAEALRAELARDVERLPELCDRLRADLRATAERERDTLLTLAREAAARIRRDAELVIRNEYAAAREALRAEVIEEAVRQATVLLREAIRPDDQEKFVRDFVATATVPS